MNALQELILMTVADRYQNDTDFYKRFGFNSGRWADFKAGRTDIDNMKYERVSAMCQSLFTDYELLLFNLARSNKQLNRTKLSVIDEYKRLKRETIQNMGDNLLASIESTLIVSGSMTNNKMRVYDETNPNVAVYTYNLSAPAGKKNRRKFILDNLDRLV